MTTTTTTGTGPCLWCGLALDGYPSRYRLHALEHDAPRGSVVYACCLVDAAWAERRHRDYMGEAPLGSDEENAAAFCERVELEGYAPRTRLADLHDVERDEDRELGIEP